jgi:SAM dependent carboxyl methyltransferase
MVASSQTPGAGMEGHGVYNANSALQASGAAFALPLLVEAADTIPLDGAGGPIVVADYGSSEGRNSAAVFKAVLPHLRARSSRPILVTHTDVPANDFSTLFDLTAHEKGGYAGVDGIYASAIGRSFYEPVLPPDYVHLGWSSYAAQWLSRLPSPVIGHFFPECGNPHERQAFAEQARADWERFLTLRSQELCAGGRLVIVLPALHEHGGHPAMPLFDAANDALADMVRDGTLQRAERDAMALPIHIRTLDELLAPLATSGLHAVTASITPIGDGAHREYLESGDAAALAARRAGFFRATFGPTLASALHRNGEPNERRSFLDRLEVGLKQQLTDVTQPFDFVAALLVLEKR